MLCNKIARRCVGREAYKDGKVKAAEKIASNTHLNSLNSWIHLWAASIVSGVVVWQEQRVLKTFLPMENLQWFHTIHLKDICLGTKVYYFIHLTSLQRLRVVQNLYLHLFSNVWIFCFWKQRLSTGNPLPDLRKHLHVALSVSWS